MDHFETDIKDLMEYWMQIPANRDNFDELLKMRIKGRETVKMRDTERFSNMDNNDWIIKNVLLQKLIKLHNSMPIERATNAMAVIISDFSETQIEHLLAKDSILWPLINNHLQKQYPIQKEGTVTFRVRSEVPSHLADSMWSFVVRWIYQKPHKFIGNWRLKDGKAGRLFQSKGFRTTVK